MKIRRALLKSTVLLVVAAVAGGAVWWGSERAQASGTWNSALVAVSGTVSGSPESVSFSGNAQVNSRLAPDPDFGSPSLVLSINLTGVSGAGSSTKSKYVIAGPEIVQKRHAASHLVDITFPFFLSGTNGTSAARSGVASFALNVDLNTGAITSATGSIASPGF
jgi:hypothetical protein